MTNVLRSPPTFPHRRAGHCGSGALRDLLELHGLSYGAEPLSEGAVFGLAGGLGFLYTELPAASLPIYLVGRTGDLERDIAPNLGLDLEVRETDEPAQGWAWVRDEVDAGRPPMLWADIGHLDYLRVRMHNTRHDIVVAGYDESAGIAWISDNDRDQLQPCSLDSLAAARASSEFPGPARHTTFVYGWPEKLPEPLDACRAAIRRAVANMRGGGGALAGLPGAFGLDGVDHFVESYPRWPERFDADELRVALNGLRIFIVKAGTGGAMFRSLHAEFLHEMAALLADDALAGSAELYDALEQDWRSLAGHAERQDHGGGIAAVERIALLERAGVEAMDAWLHAA